MEQKEFVEMDKNEKLNDDFKQFEQKIFGSNQERLNKLKTLSNDELLLKYVDLKAKNYMNEKLSFLIIPGFVLAMFAGIVKLVYEFIQRTIEISKNYGESGVILSGGLFFLFIITVTLLLVLILYWFNMKNNKKEYYLVEILLKERNMKEVNELA